MNDKATGPFSLKELLAKVVDREISLETLYARPGMNAWEPLSTIVTLGTEGNTKSIKLPDFYGDILAEALIQVAGEHDQLKALVKIVAEKVDSPPDAPLVGATKAAIPELNHERWLAAQNEFLMRLSGKAIGPWTDTWTSLLGRSLDDCVSAFMDDGLIEEASLEKKIGYKFRVADLKPLLRGCGGKVSGRKEDLIQNLLGTMPCDALAHLVADTRLYYATLSGEKRIREFIANQQSTKERVEAAVLGALVKGCFQQAVATLAEYRSHQAFPDEPRSIEEASFLAGSPCDDLSLTDPERKEVAAVMGLSCLLGENPAACAHRILARTGGNFSCPSLEQFAKENLQGVASHVFADSDLTNLAPQELVWVYVQTYFSKAHQASILKSFRESSSVEWVEVLVGEGNPPCKICNAAQLRYRIPELEGDPKLPRHWGCNCLYVPWFGA